MMKNLINKYLLLFLMVISVNLSKTQAQSYCTAGSTQCDEFISDVQIGAFSNPSSCGLGGYSDFTTLPAIDMQQIIQ